MWCVPGHVQGLAVSIIRPMAGCFAHGGVGLFCLACPGTRHDRLFRWRGLGRLAVLLGLCSAGWFHGYFGIFIMSAACSYKTIVLRRKSSGGILLVSLCTGFFELFWHRLCFVCRRWQLVARWLFITTILGQVCVLGLCAVSGWGTVLVPHAGEGLFCSFLLFLLWCFFSFCS